LITTTGLAGAAAVGEVLAVEAVGWGVLAGVGIGVTFIMVVDVALSGAGVVLAGTGVRVKVFPAGVAPFVGAGVLAAGESDVEVWLVHAAKITPTESATINRRTSRSMTGLRGFGWSKPQRPKTLAFFFHLSSRENAG
jgi:hypothetical protein